ncbi:hypothetical protein Trydic_g7013 [Trypoxylus dichotomus]
MLFLQWIGAHNSKVSEKADKKPAENFYNMLVTVPNMSQCATKKVKLENQEMAALIDTGSEDTVRLLGLGSPKMRTLGTFVGINEVKVSVKLHVVSNNSMRAKVILGNEFLEDTKKSSMVYGDLLKTASLVMFQMYASGKVRFGECDDISEEIDELQQQYNKLSRPSEKPGSEIPNYMHDRLDIGQG